MRGAGPVVSDFGGGRVFKRIGLAAGYAVLLAGLAAAATLMFGAPWAPPVWFVQLGIVVVMVGGLAGGGVLVIHLHRSLAHRPSAPLVLPSPWWFAALIPPVIASAEAQILAPKLGAEFGIAGADGGLRFALTIIIAAVLAPAAALSILLRTTGPGTTWRRAALCVTVGAGSLLAVLTLGTVVPLVGAGLVVALRHIGARLLWDLAYVKSTRDAAWMVFSGAGLYGIMTVAVAAPIAVEFLKPLGVIVLGRRVRSPREAFLLGASCGAGFAIMENILYGSFPVPWWGGIVAIRCLGAALHPLGTGLLALGWYGIFQGHQGAWRRLGAFYLVAVLQQWLWNMPLVSFVLLLRPVVSTDFAITPEGLRIAVVLLAYFAVQGAAMLVTLRYVGRLVVGVAAGQPVPALVPVTIATPRGIALVAAACLIVLMPLGAAAMQAWLVAFGRP
jgi:RsiW-degrading membrane proteinase PrsW (M82 family)